MKDGYSPEYVNALVDGELTAEERERALARLERDAAFKADTCEARTLKEMVRGAYAELPRPGHGLGPAYGWRGSWQAIAALLLLGLGLGGGWLAHDRLAGAPTFDRLAGLPEGYQPVALASRVDPNKVVLHLDSSESARLGSVLDLAQRLLEERGAKGRVEVVVNSSGLNLLRQDTSPYRERIGHLADHYADRLDFIACGQTLARFRSDGVNVVLVPEARVANTAIGQILDRMRDGWVYIKV
jgi:hypothetical protein